MCAEFIQLRNGPVLGIVVLAAYDGAEERIAAKRVAIAAARVQVNVLFDWLRN